MSQRVFTLNDQVLFADLSGDHNPLHVDRITSRRQIFGQIAVHGIHSLLWVLDDYLKNDTSPLELRAIKARFFKPIPLEVQVNYSVVCQLSNYAKIILKHDHVILSELVLEWEVLRNHNFKSPKSSLPVKGTPQVLSSEEIAVDSGKLDLHLNHESASRLFPNLIKLVHPFQVAMILGTSRLVGMKCPGLNSIYSELELKGDQSSNSEEFKYHVLEFDERFSLVTIKIAASGMVGTIKAFVRPNPVEQANYLSIKRQIDFNEFAGQRALVIGGSRGLGETTAKILVAGGADVKITYCKGNEDAQRIVQEIVDNGGSASCFQMDVLNFKQDCLQLLTKEWIPTHFYYFATPHIFSAEKGTFTTQLFLKFCDYYVIGFHNVIKQLQPLGLSNVLYPSTVAIDELPTNMGEYTAAKMAGETLCSFLEKSKKMTIYRPRLPRMATDQTVSLMPVNNQDPVQVMIGELRYFRDNSRLF